MTGQVTGHQLSGVPALPDESPHESPHESPDALSAGAGGWASGLPGQHVDPGWADRLDGQHFAIACRSSAAVLARGGCGDDARVLREVAAQAQTRIDQREHQHPEQVGGHTDGGGWPDLGLDRCNQPAQPLAPPIDDLARSRRPTDVLGQRQEDGG